MVTLEKYKQILDSGLLLDHYHVLLAIRDSKELPTSRRVKGFLNLLEKKGYILDGVLSQMCDSLLEVAIVATSTTCTTTGSQSQTSLAVWIETLHSKCQTKITKLTGTKQIRGKIEGKSYPFLPNQTDLGRVLIRAISTYRIKDFDRVEKTILSYIDRCFKSNNWFPLLNYYIMKGSSSQMVTDMEDMVIDKESDDLIVNI